MIQSATRSTLPAAMSILLERPAEPAHDGRMSASVTSDSTAAPSAHGRAQRHAVLTALREMEDELRGRGLRSLSLFGSIARDEAGEDSDVDVIVDLDPAAHVNLLDLAGLQIELTRRLGRRVDIATRHARMNPRFAARVREDEVRVF